MRCLISLCLCLAVLSFGCTVPSQRVAASVAGLAVNKVTPNLLTAYDAEQRLAIENSPTKDVAVSAVADIRLNWAPVWTAHETFYIVQNVAADKLKSGQTVDLKTVIRAFCDLQELIPLFMEIPEGLVCK